jgi:multicomponent Na+:H+ antiporter subunit C
MLNVPLLYGIAGILLFTFSLRVALSRVTFLRRVLAINVAGAGIFLVFISAAYKGPKLPADPVPQALVLTGIVVAFSATALAIALARRLYRAAADD